MAAIQTKKLTKSYKDLTAVDERCRMAAIQTKKLTKSYKDLVAVDELDLTIEEGELFSLLGVNGAGKTTTVKMLATLARPTSGEATIFGYTLGRDDAKIKEIVDISMQETAVARKLTVRENIELFARLSGQSKEEIEETAKTIYADFGLGKVANKKAAELSGGWQERARRPGRCRASSWRW